MQDRYVLLGLARARAEWFSRVGQWATAAAIPAEFVRCISVQEVRARLASGRPFSAALLDAASPGVDRDLLAVVREAGTAAIVVDDGRARPWRDLGAHAVLDPDFDRETLLEALATHASMVGGAVAFDGAEHAQPDVQRQGQLIAVTGPGGTGASVAAIALAQGLAGADRGSVLLADLCRSADQAMLHDSRVVVPSIQELVEAHRAGTPRTSDVREQTFAVAERGYRLLLGLRRARHWVTVRPQSLEATLDSLLRTFDLVVADIEAEVEGEDETGSLDVEERHAMARSTAGRADAVVVVGHPGMKGLHSLVRTLLDLLTLGVPADRLVPVVSQAPRGPRDRAEIAGALGSLAKASLGASGNNLSSPLFLPRRKVDTALRDGVALPKPLPDLLTGAVTSVLDRTAGRQPRRGTTTAAPQRVAPGSLSVFTSQQERG